MDTSVEVIAAFDGWLEEQLSAARVARLRQDLHLILEARSLTHTIVARDVELV